MYPSPESLSADFSQSSLPNQSSTLPKKPRVALDNILAFPPNRETLGGTSYLIVENEGNVMLDCPAWNEATQNFLQEQGGVRWLVISHRGGIGSKTQKIQETLNCEVLIQEQEAYLLPGVKVTTFQHEFVLSSVARMLWTAGHSPGSACLHYSSSGGVLFSGRHLLPNQLGQLVPLRTAKTFHWPRQLKNVQLLLDRFTPEMLQFICPGANIGFLRGKLVIEQAYQRLANLDLEGLLQAKAIL